MRAFYHLIPVKMTVYCPLRLIQHFKYFVLDPEFSAPLLAGNARPPAAADGKPSDSRHLLRLRLHSIQGYKYIYIIKSCFYFFKFLCANPKNAKRIKHISNSDVYTV